MIPIKPFEYSKKYNYPKNDKHFLEFDINQALYKRKTPELNKKIIQINLYLFIIHS